MNTIHQDQYIATFQFINKMLSEIDGQIGDSINPEDATYTDLAELQRIQAELLPIYNRLTKQCEYSEVVA